MLTSIDIKLVFDPPELVEYTPSYMMYMEFKKKVEEGGDADSYIVNYMYVDAPDVGGRYYSLLVVLTVTVGMAVYVGVRACIDADDEVVEKRR